MPMIRLVIVVFSLSLFYPAQAQFGPKAYETSFSQPVKLKGKDKLKATEIIAEDESRIYLIISESRDSYSQFAGVVKLQSIRKSDLEPIRTISLNQTMEKTSSYRLREVLKTSSGFLVVSEKTNQGVVSGYASQIDFDLNVISAPQKVYEIETNRSDYRVIQRPKANDFIVLKQIYDEVGMPIKITYEVYSEHVKSIRKGEAQLGLTYGRTSIFSSRSSESVLQKLKYSANGELILMTWVKSVADNQKGDYYLLFINPLTDGIDKRKVFGEGETYIGEFTILDMGEELILTGLYSDDKSTFHSFWGNSSSTPSVNSFNGTFLQRYHSSSHNRIAAFQSPFDQATLNRLAMTNPAKKIGILFSKKSREKDQDVVSGNYEIIRVIYSPDRQIATFYYEYIYNSSHTTSSYSSTGSMYMNSTTTYTSKRGNLFTYQLSLENGEMNWLNTVRKYASFSSSSSSIWDVETMFVVPRLEGDMVFYYSSRIFNEKDESDLTGMTIKTKNFDQDYLMTSIDSETGKAATQLPRLVPKRLKPYEKLQLDRSFVSEVDRACYTINSQYQYRPELGVISCVTMPFCFAGYFFYAFTKKNGFNETYTIGKVTF